MKAYDEIKTGYMNITNNAGELHRDCFVFAKELPIKTEVEIKRPCICQRQRFRQNTVGIGQTNPG